MTSTYIPTQNPYCVRARANTLRRQALAALRDNNPEPLRLARFWRHIHLARKLEAQAFHAHRPAQLQGGPRV